MRICLYSDSVLPQAGGQATAVDALARQFSAAGQEVAVLAPQPPKPLSADDRRLPYTVVRHRRFASSPRLIGWNGRALVKLHRKLAFDVLHCHSIYPCGYLAALRRANLSIPCVITSHSNEVAANVTKRAALALEQADALVTVSEFTAEGYRKLLAKSRRLTRIPYGIELEARSEQASRPTGLDPAIREGRYLLFLGPLERRNGVDLLLAALARLPAESAHAQLVIAGDGDQRPTLVSQVEQLGLCQRVRFVGPVQGAFKAYLLANASCLVAPAREAAPFCEAILEAYAASCPVIAADLPGLAELVQPGKTGWLTSPEPEMLAALLKQALSDPAGTRVMGQRAKRVVQEYTWPAVARQYLELFERLIAYRQRAAA
jgi:glycosyltransferase involved in cell wall biosynthesis